MTEQRTPLESRHIDLFELWRQFYEANEQAWTKAIKDATTTQAYAEVQGKMLETFLSFQKMMRDGMTTQLANLNLPTRDDVARLGELVTSLEEKIDRLDDRLSGLERRMPDLLAIREMLAGIDKKVGQIDKRLGSVDEQTVYHAAVGNGQARPATQSAASRAPRPRSGARPKHETTKSAAKEKSE